MSRGVVFMLGGAIGASLAIIIGSGFLSVWLWRNAFVAAAPDYGDRPGVVAQRAPRFWMPPLVPDNPPPGRDQADEPDRPIPRSKIEDVFGPPAFPPEWEWEWPRPGGFSPGGLTIPSPNLYSLLAAAVVSTLLEARVLDLELGQPYRDRDQVRLPVTLAMDDPVASMRKPALEVWRAKATAAPFRVFPSSTRQRFDLAQQGSMARGEVTLPPLAAGEVYCFQPQWEDRSGLRVRAQAQAWNAILRPLDLRSAPVTCRHEVGSRPLMLACWVPGGDSSADNPSQPSHSRTVVLLQEITEAVTVQNLAHVTVIWRNWKRDPFASRSAKVDWEGGKRTRLQLSSLRSFLLLDPQGHLLDFQSSQLENPGESRGQELVGKELERWLRILTVPLPNRTVAPGDSWQARIAGDEEDSFRPFEITYRYEGACFDRSREEGVLSLVGRVARSTQMRSREILKGKAVVDLHAGQVREVDVAVVAPGVLPPQSAALGARKVILQLRRELHGGEADVPERR